MTKRVLIWTGGDDAAFLGAVGALPGVEAIGAGDRSEALARLLEADAFVTSVVRWDADFANVLARAERLRWIQILNAGFDNMERLGVPRHVVLSTVGPVNAGVVAEHALVLLLALIRQMPAFFEAQQHREWAFGRLARSLTTLRGKHVAVLGFGHIGRAIAALATAFGARVTGIATTARVEQGVNVEAVQQLGTVLGTSDVLMVTVPLNDATERLVDAAAFGAMRRGSYLVNISRGPIVDPRALLAALEEGIVAGAALDVTDPEPLPAEHPLWTHSKVIVTPHVAGIGGGDLVRHELLDLVVDNVRRFAAGERVRHVASVRYA